MPSACRPRSGSRSGSGWHGLPARRDPSAGFTTSEGKATKRIYDLRHTFATFAIHALVPSFIIARVMGTSEAMLRKHYGHLLPDTDALVVERLNAWSLMKTGAGREGTSDSSVR